MRRTLVPVLVLLLCPALVSPVAAQSLQPAKSAVAPLYVIQPNDVLEVFVWKDPNLTRKVTLPALKAAPSSGDAVGRRRRPRA